MMIRKGAVLACALLLGMLPLSGGAEEPVPPQTGVPNATSEALSRALGHLREAFKAMGDAGSNAYQEQMPRAREEAVDALGRLQETLDRLQQKLQEGGPPASLETPHLVPDAPSTPPPRKPQEGQGYI
ncbi:MAG: hypothetical protein H7831_07390 [Magnetococcus sp. WYHC-3]